MDEGVEAISGKELEAIAKRWSRRDGSLWVFDSLGLSLFVSEVVGSVVKRHYTAPDGYNNGSSEQNKESK
jgi:hypothetical protein